ncbi:MAG: class I SAM-dependent methyltransferase [Candidatus Heimdallarchaeota archaeon]
MELEEAKKKLDLEFSFHADFVYETVEELNLPKPVKILDIGTGFGTMAMILALQGYKVITGEPEGHNWANWRSSAKKIFVEDLITFEHFDAEDLPYETSSFDAIFCLTSLHHINDKHAALKEFLRVVKDKGLIIIFELTSYGIEVVKRMMPHHPEAVNPVDYSHDLPLSLRIKEGKSINAYIFKKDLK